jgi:hypothetical protein
VIHDGRLQGPLLVLGLAESIEGGKIALTEAGYELARASSPVTADSEVTLSDEEIETFRRRLQVAPDQAVAIAEFIGAVRHVAGTETELDALLGTWHPDWSANRATAPRAAMPGRLGELRMLRVEGRGSKADRVVEHERIRKGRSR